MKEFLGKYCYIIIKKYNDVKLCHTNLYYTCAFVTDVSDTHISFLDKNRDDAPYYYSLDEVESCKLSNKVDKDGNWIDNGGKNGN